MEQKQPPPPRGGRGPQTLVVMVGANDSVCQSALEADESGKTGRWMSQQYEPTKGRERQRHLKTWGQAVKVGDRAIGQWRPAEKEVVIEHV